MALRLVKEDLWRMGFFWWSLALAHMDVTNKDQQTIWKPGDRYYEEVSEISPKPSFWHVLTCLEITTFTSSSVFNYAEKILITVYTCMYGAASAGPPPHPPWGVVVKDSPPVVWGLIYIISIESLWLSSVKSFSGPDNCGKIDSWVSMSMSGEDPSPWLNQMNRPFSCCFIFFCHLFLVCSLRYYESELMHEHVIIYMILHDTVNDSVIVYDRGYNMF